MAAVDFVLPRMTTMAENDVQGCYASQAFHCGFRFSSDTLDDFHGSHAKYRCAPYDFGNLWIGLSLVKTGPHFRVFVWTDSDKEMAQGSVDDLISLSSHVKVTVTAINRHQGRSSWQDIPIETVSGGEEVWDWTCQSRDQLEEEGWLTPEGVMRFRVDITWNEQPPHHLAVSHWCPNVCANRLWLTRNEFADFRIMVRGGKELLCHRAILAAASPVFARMMSGAWEEALQVCERSDVSDHEMLLLLEYIYVGHLPVDVDCITLTLIAKLADYYQMPNLVEQCASRIVPLICESNIIEVCVGLQALTHTNPTIKDLLHCIIEDVRNQPQLLYIVFTSLKAPATPEDQSVPSDDESVSASFSGHSLCHHRSSANGAEGCPDSQGRLDIGSNIDLGSQFRNAWVTGQNIPITRPLVASEPPGLDILDATGYYSEALSGNDRDFILNTEDGGLHQSSVPEAGGQARSSGSQAVNSNEPCMQACNRTKGPRRKTRRGKAVKTWKARPLGGDLNSLPDTHNSWE